MKIRIVSLILSFVLMTGMFACAEEISKEAAEEKALQYILQQGIDYENERENFKILCSYFNGEDVQDIPECWNAEVSYERCAGMLEASLYLRILMDGSIIAPSEDDSDSFENEIQQIRACTTFYQAQRMAEQENGPLRNWPEADREAFLAEHGDLAETFESLGSPQPTEYQYWEMEQLARSEALKNGHSMEEMEALKARCVFSSSDTNFIPTQWEISFYDGERYDPDKQYEYLRVEIILDGMDIQDITITEPEEQGFLDVSGVDKESETYREFEASFQ